MRLSEKQMKQLKKEFEEALTLRKENETTLFKNHGADYDTIKHIRNESIRASDTEKVFYIAKVLDIEDIVQQIFENRYFDERENAMDELLELISQLDNDQLLELISFAKSLLLRR